jgi:hypothetical protein
MLRAVTASQHKAQVLTAQFVTHIGLHAVCATLEQGDQFGLSVSSGLSKTQTRQPSVTQAPHARCMVLTARVPVAGQHGPTC